MYVNEVAKLLPVPSNANILFFYNKCWIFTDMVTKCLVNTKGGLCVNQFDTNAMLVYLSKFSYPIRKLKKLFLQVNWVFTESLFVNCVFNSCFSENGSTARTVLKNCKYPADHFD